MPLLLIRRPAFLAHLRGLDSISPTVFPAHTFILSELMPVNPTFKVITAILAIHIISTIFLYQVMPAT